MFFWILWNQSNKCNKQSGCDEAAKDTLAQKYCIAWRLLHLTCQILWNPYHVTHDISRFVKHLPYSHEIEV